jgi:hypothetical protein
MLGSVRQASKSYLGRYSCFVGLLSVVAVAETIVSLAWGDISYEPRGLWYLAAWAAFPLTIRIEFVDLFLELGYYTIYISIGRLVLVSLSSPYCGVSCANPENLLFALTTRAAGFPILLVMNMVPIPILCLGLRHLKSSRFRKA